jgi:hypothetical protein
MASSVINSDDGVISGTSGLKSSGGDDGSLKIQTNGTDAASVTSGQVVSFVNNFGTVANLPAYQCRAWVNFNGSGTVAILASGNVSSITDNGVGEYTVNFTTAMPDANYQVSCAGFIQANNARRLGVQGVRGTFNNPSTGYATGSVQIGCAIGDSGNGNAEMADTDRVGVAIFR